MPASQGAATELVCFKLMNGNALRAVEKLWQDSGIVAARESATSLSPVNFRAWNRLTGGSLAGRVF